MALYAISDFHLAINSDKPMDIFGQNWNKHDEKIKENWTKKINSQDTVLIAGDISWSMRIENGLEDLKWISELPGNKIIVKGNHDFWWSGITKLNSLFEGMSFIQNNFFTYEDFGICGTRGWICPGSENFKEHDEKIYERELVRLRLSLEKAKTSGYDKCICMLHYPPTNEHFENSGFIDIFHEFGVKKVIYGHLHGPFLYKLFTGTNEGIEYNLTSCDYINFDPILIAE